MTNRRDHMSDSPVDTYLRGRERVLGGRLVLSLDPVVAAELLVRELGRGASRGIEICCAIVRPSPHPFWLRWEAPPVRIARPCVMVPGWGDHRR